VKSGFRIKFWGVRGSYPVPGRRTLKYGGNTTCLEVWVDHHLFILDAGTGIIDLGEDLAALKSPIIATILFSHTHHDHTEGFPFFKPAYDPRNRLYLFGPSTFNENLETVLSTAMLPSYFPVRLRDMASSKLIRNIEDCRMVIMRKGATEPTIINNPYSDTSLRPGDARIEWIRSRAHPKDGVVVYKIGGYKGSIVFATDLEGYVGGDKRLIGFCRDADVLIHDAQFTVDEYMHPKDPRQGWGHSTPEMAVAVAREAGVRRLILFHYDPLHSDKTVAALERSAYAQFPKTQAAWEGLEIEL
jgi:phosphoribosyl 1,2-cyclic phosphodiesterase